MSPFSLVKNEMEPFESNYLVTLLLVSPFCLKDCLPLILPAHMYTTKKSSAHAHIYDHVENPGNDTVVAGTLGC